MSAFETPRVGQSRLTQAQQFEHLRDAGAAVGFKLVFGGIDQGGYWLSHGNHTTWLPDLKAVNRALVTGCGLHQIYPTLRLVTMAEPEPAKLSAALRKRPQSIADIRAGVERRRLERANNEWWRKDQTPQNQKKRVLP